MMGRDQAEGPQGRDAAGTAFVIIVVVSYKTFITFSVRAILIVRYLEGDTVFDKIIVPASDARYPQAAG